MDINERDSMTTELSTNTTPARGLALATFDDAYRFAKMVSGSDFAPKDFRGKPESCLLAIQHGSEIGLSPMQSLQSIAVINGRPSIWGDAALAVVSASSVCEYVTEEIEDGKDGEALVAICTAKRRGYPKPTVVRFTVTDAKKAGLWGKGGPWTQYPRRMLQLRARGFALRDAFPDVLKGLVTAEEAQDYSTPTQAPEPVVVRPKFDTPAEPAAPAPAGNTFDNARAAIEKAATVDALEALRSRVEQRLKDKTFTPFQSDELLDLIHSRIEFFEGDRDSVPFDSAEAQAEASH
jgi:hypothetical protein